MPMQTIFLMYKEWDHLIITYFLYMKGMVLYSYMKYVLVTVFFTYMKWGMCLCTKKQNINNITWTEQAHVLWNHFTKFVIITRRFTDSQRPCISSTLPWTPSIQSTCGCVPPMELGMFDMHSTFSQQIRSFELTWVVSEMMNSATKFRPALHIKPLGR